ncbi:uncharacterized protein CDAR_306271, partial [Caerostris darwini]
MTSPPLTSGERLESSCNTMKQNGERVSKTSIETEDYDDSSPIAVNFPLLDLHFMMKHKRRHKNKRKKLLFQSKSNTISEDIEEENLFISGCGSIDESEIPLVEIDLENIFFFIKLYPEIRSRLLDAESLKHGLELVILIDRSSSIDPADFQVGVGFVKFLLQEFGVKNGDNVSGTRAAVIAFGTKVDVLFNLDNATIKGPKTANKALDTLEPSGGGTDMKEAFVDVFTLVTPNAREQAKRALFLLTDGEPNIGDIEDTKSLAKQLKERNEYEIFTVGIGRGINRQLLSELASEPLISHIFIMDNYMDLRTVMDTIKDKAQRPKPINPARCGYIKQEKNYLKHWTWLAAVYVNSPDKYNATNLQFCSGTLICEQWVITAASCFYHTYQNNGTEEFKKTTEAIFVVLGEKNLMQTDRNQMSFYAEGVFIHPDFRAPDGLENNLALIKLNAPAPPKRFRPVCLPPAERPILLHLELNINVSIAGWGLPPPFDNEREVTGGTVRFRSSNISIALETEDRCRMHDEQQPMSGSIFCAGGLG